LKRLQFFGVYDKMDLKKHDERKKNGDGAFCFYQLFHEGGEGGERPAWIFRIKRGEMLDRAP
jgi:hypothetical protein